MAQLVLCSRAMGEADDVEELRLFTCPRCGEHRFGTDLYANLGICHGGMGRPGKSRCDFTWLRSSDDLYFTGTGHFVTKVQVAQSTRANPALPIDEAMGEPTNRDVDVARALYERIGPVPERRGGPFWTDIVMYMRRHGFAVVDSGDEPNSVPASLLAGEKP